MKSMCLSSDQFRKMPPIQPLDQTLEASLRARIERKAKPPGSLGRAGFRSQDKLALRLHLRA
jgi:hypothetical protein